MSDQKTTGYLLIKRGLYYRPGSMGYTGIKDHAGRYTLAEAMDHDDRASGVTYVHEDDAPMFSENCFDDLARAHVAGKLAEAEARAERVEAENARLRKALDPFARVSSEGVVKQQTGHARIVTCAEYFHEAAAALSPAPTVKGDG